MARTSTYLNFPRHTEEAFNFYRTVFGTEFGNDGIVRLGQAPAVEGAPPLSAEDKELVMHIELPIVGGHVLWARMRQNQWVLRSISETIFISTSNLIAGRKPKGCLMHCLRRYGDHGTANDVLGRLLLKLY